MLGTTTSRVSRTSKAAVQTQRFRLGSLMGVQVVGLGSSVPDNIVTNEDLASLGYDAFRQGRVHRGGLVLFSGFGAGLTWGTVLMRW